MTGAGELRRDADAYELAGDLARRQAEQQSSLSPRRASWDGTWRMAVAVTAGPRPAAVRTDLRRALGRARLAEWREGVWIRPRNLEMIEDARCAWLDVRPDADPAALAAALFAPEAWSRDGAWCGRTVGDCDRVARGRPGACHRPRLRGRCSRVAARARRSPAAGRAPPARLARRRAASGLRGVRAAVPLGRARLVPLAAVRVSHAAPAASSRRSSYSRRAAAITVPFDAAHSVRAGADRAPTVQGR